MTPRLRDVPGARALGRAVLPARRRDAAQWRRIEAAVPPGPVRSGPFEGMCLGTATTGSHIPKRLGCYEAELHDLIHSWHDYHTILDVGCGEGWYVVGLARRMPGANIVGFDSSDSARTACASAVAENGVDALVLGPVGPAELVARVDGPTLLIVDIEGAEADLLDEVTALALPGADLLVETHDFAAPGITDAIRARFPDRQSVHIAQLPRDPDDYPALAGLSRADAARAVDESRHPAQSWLWLPTR